MGLDHMSNLTSKEVREAQQRNAAALGLPLDEYLQRVEAGTLAGFREDDDPVALATIRRIRELGMPTERTKGIKSE
jgi:hypothetical protein